MFQRGFKTWCENVAVQYRRRLGLHVFDPLDPFALAKYLGVEIWTPHDVPGVDQECLDTLLVTDTDGWSAITIAVASKSVIILNSEHSRARQASDIAHELSHIILGHKPARMDVTEDGIMILSTYDARQEDEAAWLSGCLLLPRPALITIARSSLDARNASSRYGVSTDMLQYRRNVTGVDHQLKRSQARSRA
jgi:Zn-dependent peptidase ImmA (M78 family)